MSDIFRKSVLNRLPAMAPTKAPWAAEDEDAVEELDGEDEEQDGIQELGAVKSFT
jgi:protein phosphatase methylesterase 1